MAQKDFEVVLYNEYLIIKLIIYIYVTKLKLIYIYIQIIIFIIYIIIFNFLIKEDWKAAIFFAQRFARFARGKLAYARIF